MLQEEKEEAAKALVSPHDRKLTELGESDDRYNRAAWFIYSRITNTKSFKFVVSCALLLTGVLMGVDLQFTNNPHPTVTVLVDVVAYATQAVFALEAALKIVAEGRYPLRYFTDPADGKINTFDFSIVLFVFAFMGTNSPIGKSIGRLLRLMRLLTFVKGVRPLRVIVSGLLVGMQSVSYIVLLLLLIIFLFAIVGCIFFGPNDPAHFGTGSICLTSPALLTT